MNDDLLREAADAAGTPFYAYDLDVFRERLRGFATFGPHETCFAVKANDALAILRVVASEAVGADVVSAGELRKATLAGIDPARIVFSGVGKRRDEIRLALELGIRSLNVESLAELDVVAEEARMLRRPARVSIRLNPEVTPATHAYLTTGAHGSKFGLPRADALEALRRARDDDALEPVGISFHVGSQIVDVAPIVDAAAEAAQLWRDATAEGVTLRDLDAGGGLGVAYTGGEGPDVRAYVDALARVAHDVGARLVLEPGRYLVAAVGTFVTRVLYVKEAAERAIVVCDGGMNDFARPALYGAEHPVRVLGRDDPPRPVDVVGPLCESGDFLALGRDLPLPRAGDLVAVGLAGAYGRVMSSSYNARPLCAEIAVEGGEWRVTRDAGSFDDLVRGERA